ncbi:MAG TPA: alpha/beta hydrolase [Anaerolineales bacterium]|nr:alpha/beta hydrolase [Anaerolineales bacterium]
MSAIILDGSMVHYEALGRGRPIIFLHGWVGSWRYWINAMQAASTSFRAYAIDLFGFGDTVRSENNYTIEKQALLLERFLNEMGIGKVALVGHDLGALVAFEYLKKHYESVDRMMTIGVPLQYETLATRMRTAPTTELAEWLSARQPDALTALADASKADPVAVTTSMSSLQVDGIFPSVRNFGVPCLFVYGANDPAFTTVPSQETSNLPIHMHQINLEGSGHYPMLDNVSQFNRLLIDFLALDSGASPSELQMKEEWKRRVR